MNLTEDSPGLDRLDERTTRRPRGAFWTRTARCGARIGRCGRDRSPRRAAEVRASESTHRSRTTNYGWADGARLVALAEARTSSRGRRAVAPRVRRAGSCAGCMPSDADVRIHGRHNAMTRWRSWRGARRMAVTLGPSLQALRASGENRTRNRAGRHGSDAVEYYDDSREQNVGATLAAIRGWPLRADVVGILAATAAAALPNRRPGASLRTRARWLLIGREARASGRIAGGGVSPALPMSRRPRCHEA